MNKCKLMAIINDFARYETGNVRSSMYVKAFSIDGVDFAKICKKKNESGDSVFICSILICKTYHSSYGKAVSSILELFGEKLKERDSKSAENLKKMLSYFTGVEAKGINFYVAVFKTDERDVIVRNFNGTVSQSLVNLNSPKNLPKSILMNEYLAKTTDTSFEIVKATEAFSRQLSLISEFWTDE